VLTGASPITLIIVFTAFSLVVRAMINYKYKNTQ